VVAIFSGWLSLWVNPRAVQMMGTLRIHALNDFQLSTLMPHRFESFGNGRVVYVTKASHQHDKDKGVFLALADKGKSVDGRPKWDIVQADQAYQAKQPDTAGNFVVMQDGTRYSGVAGSPDMTVSKFKRYGINIASNLIFGQNHKKRKLDHKQVVESMSTSSLFHHLHDGPIADAELQLRFAIPISILIASLIAVALSEVDPRRGRYFNMIPAVLLYIFYACMIFLSRSWMMSGVISRDLGMWWIHGLMLVVALALFAYRIGWQRIRQLAGVTA
jgi:lipopolysaccharide export system permease protein